MKNFPFPLGIPTKIFHYLLMFLTALTLIAAFRAVGVLLVLSFFVGPALIARQWTHRLIPLIVDCIRDRLFCHSRGSSSFKTFVVGPSDAPFDGRHRRDPAFTYLCTLNFIDI